MGNRTFWRNQTVRKKIWKPTPGETASTWMDDLHSKLSSSEGKIVTFIDLSVIIHSINATTDLGYHAWIADLQDADKLPPSDSIRDKKSFAEVCGEYVSEIRKHTATF